MPPPTHLTPPSALSTRVTGPPPLLTFYTGSGDLKLVPCVCIGSYRLSHSPAHLVSAFHSIVFQDPHRHGEVSSPWSCTPLTAGPLISPQSTEMRAAVCKGCTLEQRCSSLVTRLLFSSNKVFLDHPAEPELSKSIQTTS